MIKRKNRRILKLLTILNLMKKLNRLTKSMNKSEIRYFKMNAELNRVHSSEESEYALLFNELVLKRESNNEHVLKNASNVQKEYLNERLLDILLSYSKVYNIAARERKLIEKAKLLFSRNLDVDCLKLLKRIEKEAKHNEDLLLLLEVNDLYRHRRDMGKYDQDYLELYKKETDILSKLTELRLQEHLAHQIYMLHLSTPISIRNKEKGRNAIEYFTQLDDLQENQEFRTFKANYHYQWSLSLIEYYKFGATEKLIHLIENRLQLFEADKIKKKAFRSLYLIALSHYVSTIQTLGREKIQDDILNNLLEDNEFSKNLNAHDFYLLGHNFLKSISFFGDLERKAHFIVFINNALKKLERLITVETKITIYYELAYVNFIYNKHGQALQNIAKIIDLGFEPKFLERQVMARMMRIMIFLEKGDYDYVESLIPSTKKFVLKINRLNDFEKILLAYFSKIARTQNKQDRKEINLGFSKKLSSLGLAVERMRYYFDFKMWNKAQVEDRPMHEILDEK
jgi:hypothetical protein